MMIGALVLLAMATSCTPAVAAAWSEISAPSDVRKKLGAPAAGRTDIYASLWDSLAAHSSPFEVKASEVCDAASGKPLSHTIIERGTCRIETLYFFARTLLQNLRRTTVTSKRFGFIWKRVKTDVLSMGTFPPKLRPYSYQMPKAEIPTAALACGSYRLRITYTADNHDGVLSEEEVDFVVV
ncbi:hypothetical protein AB1Y20_018040 [Prymnesium parvum]|uniref:Uncharacterized protein n=1 Tax=Prymnesium parvum TaxID=97485 RepID=A0AB34JLZ2_PRYPA